MNKQARLEQDGVRGTEYVLFYRASDDFGEFSNFSRHPVTLRNPWTGELQKYWDGETRFQAMKATNEDDHNYVARASSPFNAKERGGPGEDGIELRADWGDTYGSVCYYVMLELVLAKTLQHGDVQEALIRTEDWHIYEDSPTDDIWGWRYRNDFRGKNLLGRAWMDARHLLF